MASLLPIQYHHNSNMLYKAISALPYACWLDSGRPNSHRGRYDILTALPQKRLVSYIDNGIATTTISTIDSASLDSSTLDSPKLKEQRQLTSTDCPFALLSKELEAIKPESTENSVPFIGGALGYWGYELGSYLMSVKTVAPTTKPLADMVVGIYHWAIIQDHQTQQAYLAYLDSCQPSIIEHVKDAIHQTTPKDKPFKAEPIKPTETQAQYIANVDAVLNYIAAGDCYQVNYAQQFTAEYMGEPYTAYQHLRELMASPYSAYMDLGNQQAVLSLSPERFIKVENGEVLTQPIKGTAPRSDDPITDKHNAEALLSSEKNRAENVMIVDLLRNDLGKHCQPGSIKVPELFTLKSYPNVHHLVSNVVGKLKADSNSLDLLRDSLPGGSITGAPKKRSMEIIQALEKKRRGIYCGCIGYINHKGDMDTNIAIRTVSCNQGQLECWGGGGIVADSQPQDEYQETFNKVGMILRNLWNL